MADVRALIGEHPAGISRADLLAAARSRLNPDLTERQLDGELERLADDLDLAGGLIRLRAIVDEEAAAETGDPHRLVAIDLETVLRYIEQRPEGDRTIFQVGAVRFGPDQAWADSAPPFDRFIRLPDDLAARIVKPDIRETVQALGDEPGDVLADLLEYLGLVRQ